MLAENVAQQWMISREEQDRFAVSSQNKTKQAVANSVFKEEIVAVTVRSRNNSLYLCTIKYTAWCCCGGRFLIISTLNAGSCIIVSDEFPKPHTTIEGLSQLKPAFNKENGTVTAGNASGINDGASAVVVASKTAVEQLGLNKPLAKVVSWAQAGVDPAIMGTGPIPAVRKAVSIHCKYLYSVV